MVEGFFSSGSLAEFSSGSLAGPCVSLTAGITQSSLDILQKVAQAIRAENEKCKHLLDSFQKMMITVGAGGDK